MKIGHICTGYPIRYPGGITNYVRSLAESQVRNGDQVVVVCGPNNVQLNSGPMCFEEWNYSSLRSRPFSLKMREEDPACVNLLSKIKKEQFDVLHFHMGLDLPVSFYRTLSRGAIPYAVSLHDYFLICPRITMINYRGEVEREVNYEKCERCVGYFDQIDIFEKLRMITGIYMPRVPTKQIKYRNDIMKQFLLAAKIVLPVSRRVQEIFAAVVPDANYHVCHIGNASADATPSQKIPSEKIRLTILGTISLHKGAAIVERFLRAVTRSDVVFQFFGRSDRAIMRRLTSLGLVDCGPYVPRDLAKIMAMSDMGVVVPVWEDNAPQVVMEFLNFGVPVLGTMMGGITDFVHEGNGILFDPHDEGSIATVINRMNEINLVEIAALARGAKRLKTPFEHGQEISGIYEAVASNG